MSWFSNSVGPRAALRDLAAFTRQRSREQVIGASLAVLITTIIVILFFVDPQTGAQVQPPIIYAQSWNANRTDAEIKADQKKEQEARRAEQLAKQQAFQNLANEFGIE